MVPPIVLERLTEQILLGFAQKGLRRALGRRPLESSNQRDGTTGCFGHYQAGGGGQLICYRDDGGGELAARAVYASAMIVQGIEAGHAERDIYHAVAPW